MKTYWTTTNNIKHIYLITLQNTSIYGGFSIFVFLCFSPMYARKVSCLSTLVKVLKSEIYWYPFFRREGWESAAPRISIPFRYGNVFICTSFSICLWAQWVWSFARVSRGGRKRVTEEILIIPWNFILINLPCHPFRRSPIERSGAEGKTYYI